MTLRRFSILALLIAIALAAACDAGPGPADADADSDADADAEVDADVDHEADADPDGDVTEPCEGGEVVAFVHVGVVSMVSDAVLDDQTVIATDGRICAIGPSDAIAPPEGATLVDGAGQWLAPGLADLHVHLNQPEDLPLYVANGVTTVRVMWGRESTLELRERVRSGEVLGPEIWTTGPLMDGDPPYWPGSEVVTSPAQAAASVEDQAAAGYDFIKVYSRLTLSVYDAIVAVAAEVGLPVVGHVPDAVGLDHVLDSGQLSIEHLEGYDLEASDGAAEARTAELGVWNCPTLVVFDRYARVAELQSAPPEGIEYVHPALVESWAGAEPYAPQPIEAYEAKVAELLELGAPLVAGTDASNPFVLPGFSLVDELVLLEASGLTRFEALRAATVAAAELLGTAARSGTIEVGKDADLVLLDGDPLESLDHLRDPAGVMLDGRWLARAELQGLLDGVRADLEVRYGLGFDCGFPPDHATPAPGDHAHFRVAGAISDPLGETEYLARDVDAVVGGTPLDVSSYFGYAERANALDLAVSAFGTMEATGADSYTYGYLSLELPRAALVVALESGAPAIDLAEATLWLAEVELRMVGVDDHYRLCPVAARDPDAEGDGLWGCFEGNESFGVGEPLRLAGSFALTTDAVALQAASGISGCACWRNQYEPLDCDDF